ncbi:chain-length determining protein [Arthrobacter sp. 24S4-2]|uniref:chain-length determining protein n=1 Tax=Arthrobacter sp. 24S4-2 TaxID=2575374 RepID=UPI0015869E7E|nr:chain-length determining protein [Arthrobacter sp. 24S4-2]
MTPFSVLKMLWHHKISMVSVLLFTLMAGSYVYFFAPRDYSASTVYVLVTPKVPSSEQLMKDPALAALNSDNPYLRSADSSLITQVMATKLGSADTVDAMAAAGLSRDYTITLPSTSGVGQLIRIEASGESPEQAIATAETLGTRLTAELRSAQKVNGADDRYLFTALQIDPPNKATEQFSSRLRSLIVVLIGGIILLFGAVSIARAVETTRKARTKSSARKGSAERNRAHKAAAHADGKDAPADSEEPQPPAQDIRSPLAKPGSTTPDYDRESDVAVKG